MVAQNAEKNPHGTAIEYCGKTWTFKEADELSDNIARGMLSRGIKKGSHVGILSSDTPALLLFMFAIHKIGAVSVLFNPAYSEQELGELLEFTDVQFLACGNVYRDTDLRERASALSGLKETFFIGEYLETGEMAAFLNDGLGVQDSILREAMDSAQPSDVSTILFTSGTTGTPKAVMMTHFSQVNTGFNQAKDLMATKDDRFCVGIPMFHCFCLSATVLAATAVTGCICFPKNLRTANVMDVLSKGCTIFNSVPSLFFALLARPDFKSYDLSALRIGLIGGAGYTMEQFKSIEDGFGFRLMSSLGMTEATGGITVNNPDDSLEVRSGTVGHFMKDVKGSILHIETGKELEAGETGELCIEGFMVMKGYYKQPELTKLAIDEKGRLHTGDLGFIDSDGNLHITGRLKELINRGGEKISPYQIENCLIENDSRIKGAKVIGIPDKHYGEEICACVILSDGARMSEEDVRDLIRKNLAYYKVPRYVLFYDEFPCNFKGKVTNKVLQDSAVQKLIEQGIY